MAYGVEVSTKKSKIMTNSMNNFSADISMNGQKLEEETSFKYLGPTLCKDGTRSAEVHITRQDLVVLHYQLCMQVQALQAPCHLNPPLQLSNMVTACWLLVLTVPHCDWKACVCATFYCTWDFKRNIWQIIPCLSIFFKKWRLACAHQFHSQPLWPNQTYKHIYPYKRKLTRVHTHIWQNKLITYVHALFHSLRVALTDAWNKSYRNVTIYAHKYTFEKILNASQITLRSITIIIFTYQHYCHCYHHILLK